MVALAEDLGGGTHDSVIQEKATSIHTEGNKHLKQNPSEMMLME